MANVTFEGNAEDLSEKQLNFISKIFVEHGYGGATVNIKNVGEADENYSANVKRFVAEKDGKVFRMVIKVAAKNPAMRMKLGTVTSFHNEDVVYREILPLFTELEKSAGIPENERLRYAKFYGALLDEIDELILLEDLQVPGYIMFDRLKSLTDHDIKLVLRTFARLHALSFVLRNKNFDKFNSFKGKLIHIFESLLEQEQFVMFFHYLERELVTLMDGEKYKQAITGSLSKLPIYFKETREDDITSRFSVIQQGDAWTNNIMFKVEEGKAVQCCMVDYQQSQVNSPVADLHYMLFNCTDYETRKKHYNDWIDYYYTELVRNLSLFGLKAEETYPKEELEKDSKRHARLSFSLVLVVNSVILREKGDAEKLKKTFTSEDATEILEELTNIKLVKENTLKLMKTKIEGIVDSFLELGLL